MIYSENDVLTSNDMNSTQYNSIYVGGSLSSYYNHTIGTDNLVEGYPVNYTYNVNNAVYDSVDYTQYGQVIFAWCNNITVSNSNFSYDSLNIFNTSNSDITGNIINTNVGRGIFITSSYNSTYSSNNITTTGANGVGINHNANMCNNNTYLNNNITTYSSYAHGIMSYCYNSNFTNNNILVSGSNSYGIYVAYTGSTVTGGSVRATNPTNYYGDYGVSNTADAVNFTNTNFTGSKTILFLDTASWFIYRNDTGNVWLKTKDSVAWTNITRTLNNWSQTNMSWSDSASTSVVATYNLSGLLANTGYRLYNFSQNYMNLSTDGNGDLSFTIELNSTSREIRVEQIEKISPALILSNNTASVNTTGLLAYYKFDEGLGNASKDYSGNDYDGTRGSGVNQTADSGTNATLLNETAPDYRLSYVDDFYNGWTLKATSGAAQGSTTTISDYTVYSSQNHKEATFGSSLTGFTSGDSYHIYYDDETGPDWTSDGRFGTALFFDGHDDYFNPDLPSFVGQSEMTIEAWIKPESVSGTHYIFIKNGPIYFRLENDKLVLTIYNGTAGAGHTGSYNIEANKWYHVAGTYDGSYVRLYVNGVSDGSSPQTGSMQGNGCAQIGRSNNGGCDGGDSSYFNGTIDEFRIWNRTLSADEIRELYESTVPYSTQTNFSMSETNSNDDDVYYDFYRNGTVSAIWHFDEGSGNYTFDETGNNNTGRLQNSTHGVPKWKSGTDCKYGGCLEFDAVGDYVVIPYSSNLNFTKFDQLTAETWVKFNTTNPSYSFQTLMQKDWNMFRLLLGNDSRLDFNVWNTSGNNTWLSDNTVLSANQWYHIVAVLNTTHLKIYINGTETSSSDWVGGPIYDNSQPLTLGRYSYVGDSYYLNGTLDEVKIYPRALTDEEVLCHYGNNCSAYGLWNETATLDPGYYYYTARASSGANYTSSSLLLPLNVSGSICKDLTTANSVYTLLNNVSSNGTCFNIKANNITIDCQGYTINYSMTTTGYAVNDTGYNFTKIRNCNIVQNSSGNYNYSIYFYNANNGTIDNNTITINSLTWGNGPVYMQGSSWNNITNNNLSVLTGAATIVYLYQNSNYNRIDNNIIISQGTWMTSIVLYQNSKNNITNNIINSTPSTLRDYGIDLWSETNTYIANNTFNVKGYAISIGPEWGPPTQTVYYNHTMLNNTQYGKPVYYYFNNDSITIENDDNIGELFIANSTNVTLRNISMDLSGLLLAMTRNSLIEDSNISTDWGYGFGIYLFSDSSNNTIRNTTITTSSYGSPGINLYGSNYSTIQNNTIITYQQASDAFWMSYTSFNTISDNNLQTLYTTASTDPSVTSEILSMTNSTQNNIYNNIFNVSNTSYIYFDGEVFDSYWNTSKQPGTRIYTSGKYIGGNYWTNSTGDGFSDTCADTNKDGFCDSYYEINATGPNRDYLPLSGDYDSLSPQIEFVEPTNSTGAHLNINHTYVNVSITDDINTSSFVDWNNSLFGYWKFEEGSGSIVNNNASSANSLTVNGLVNNTWVPGKYGIGINISNTTTYLSNTSGVGFPDGSTLTLEAWIKPYYLHPGYWDDMVEIGDTSITRGYGLEAYMGNLSLAGYVVSDVTSNVTLDTNVWQHVAITWDTNADEVRFYKNGVLGQIVTDSDELVSPQDGDSIVIGRWIDSTNAPYQGEIDEIRVWSRVLSSQEIKASYNSGLYRLENNFTNLPEGAYSYYAYAIDQNGNTNKTETRNLTVDITAPKYFNNSTNNTVAALPTLFSVNWTDNYGLSGYIFETNNTGTPTNESWISFENQTGDAIFIDGFESGNFSAWTGNYTTTGETVSINNYNPFGGFYHLYSTTNGGTGEERSYVYKSISGMNQLNVRAYVRIVSGLPLGADGQRFHLLQTFSGDPSVPTNG